MKIPHPAITSHIYELVKVVEFTLTLDETWPLRIEIFHDTEREDHYRVRLWLHEMHRLQPTFPMDRAGHPRTDHAQDVVIPFEWSNVKMGNYAEIVAGSADDALDVVLRDLRSFLDHVTQENPQ